MDNKLVVIGDLIRSRELNNTERKKMQQILQNSLEELNNNSQGMLSPYTITLGDEFQAVFKSADSILADSWQILARLHPVGVRFSYCIGTITTPINRKQAIGMDGPVFHAAREGIEKLKKSNYLFTISMVNSNQEQEITELINDLLKMISKEMKNWQKNRFQILHRLSRNVKIKDIAEELKLSESAVYKNRDEGELDLILNAEKKIVRILNKKL